MVRMRKDLELNTWKHRGEKRKGGCVHKDSQPRSKKMRNRPKRKERSLLLINNKSHKTRRSSLYKRKSKKLNNTRGEEGADLLLSRKIFKAGEELGRDSSIDLILSCKEGMSKGGGEVQREKSWVAKRGSDATRGK